MIEITVDLFSGRPNPSWLLPDVRETKEILQAISQDRDMVEPVGSGYQGLGFRGVLVRFTEDGLAIPYGLPPYFQIGNRAGKSVARGLAVAERLVQGMTKQTSRTIHPQKAVLLDADLEKEVLRLMYSTPVVTDHTQLDIGDILIQVAPGSVRFSVLSHGKASPPCLIETRVFDPGFWNEPYHVRLNNCYNYATNRRTDTFAQPGSASRKHVAGFDCQGVSAAALSDGAKQRGDCCPDQEKPRWLMALVVAPGFDYHWYRLHADGFWGHKPGEAVARNADNNGHIIVNPEYCAREPYTEFCGCFYAPASMGVE